VDMWSLGCILGELLGESTMFPGESTMNQLEKILEVLGKPSKDDMKAIKSKHTATMLDSISVKNKKSWSQLYPNAPTDALDLLDKLLQFNPDKRINADQALQHPYLAQFHNPADEPVLTSPITISIDDNKRFKIQEYRKYLYRKIIERKKQLRQKKKAAKGGKEEAGDGEGDSDSSGPATPKGEKEQQSATSTSASTSNASNALSASVTPAPLTPSASANPDKSKKASVSAGTSGPAAKKVTGK